MKRNINLVTEQNDNNKHIKKQRVQEYFSGGITMIKEKIVPNEQRMIDKSPDAEYESANNKMEALEICKENDFPLFGLEYPKSGAKNFLCGPYSLLFEFFNQNFHKSPNRLKFHEHVINDQYTKIYMDIEWDHNINKEIDPIKSCLYIGKSMCSFIKDYLKMDVDLDPLKNVCYLTASRVNCKDAKQSFHIIFDQTVLLKSCYELKLFMTLFSIYLVQKELRELNKKRSESMSYNPAAHGGSSGRISIFRIKEFVSKINLEQNKKNHSDLLKLYVPSIDMNVYNNKEPSLRTYFSTSHDKIHNKDGRLHQIKFKNKSGSKYRRVRDFDLEVLKKSLIQYVEKGESNIIGVVENKVSWNELMMDHNKQIGMYNVKIINLIAMPLPKFDVLKYKSDIYDINMKKAVKKLGSSGDNIRKYVIRAIGKECCPGINTYGKSDAYEGACNQKVNKEDELIKYLTETIVKEYADNSHYIFKEKVEPVISSIKKNHNNTLVNVELKQTKCGLKFLNSGRRHTKTMNKSYDNGQYFVINLVRKYYHQKCHHGSCKTLISNKKTIKYKISQEIIDNIKKLIINE